LPHAVFSTAFLIDAILVHEELSSRSDGTSSVIISPLTIRSLYATAIARFVTGLCDTAQNAAVKRSMYDMATELGIPERWVEIRHEITHGQIPDLRALEECAREGVAWLWEVFWSRLDVKGRADDREKKKVELSGLLRTYLKERRNDIRSGKNGDPGGTVKTVLGYAKADKDLRIVAEVLVEDKLMLPNQKS
jgi:ribosomal biogenesis protein LAS1